MLPARRVRRASGHDASRNSVAAALALVQRTAKRDEFTIGDAYFVDREIKLAGAAHAPFLLASTTEPITMLFCGMTT